MPYQLSQVTAEGYQLGYVGEYAGSSDYPYAAPAESNVGGAGVDSNSGWANQGWLASDEPVMFGMDSLPTGWALKEPYADLSEVPTQNNVNDYLQPPEGFEGTVEWVWRRQYAGGTTVTWPVSLTVDIVSPAVTVNSITTSDTTPTVTGTYDDPTASISVVLNGVTYTPTLAHPNWSFTAETLTAGAYTASATVTDGAGNVTVSEGTVTIQAFSLTAANKITTDQTPTLTGTTNDPGATITVTVNGVGYAATINGTEWTAQVTATLPYASYTVDVNATDSNGTTANATANLTVYDPSIVVSTGSRIGFIRSIKRSIVRSIKEAFKS